MTDSFLPDCSYSEEWKIDMPARMTKAASKQTYYTFRLLVDSGHVQDAYRSYAYFRWVDDQLDCNFGTQKEKISFLNRQLNLLDASYRKESCGIEFPQEQMLVDLISHDHEESSGLQCYLRNMMAVMSFDTHRKGRRITRAELNHYSHMLSVAVTELMFYFLDHGDHPLNNADRYHAVEGAHIAHMLRDMLDDIDLGYINVPVEILETQKVSLADLHSPAFRAWVQERVWQANRYIRTGRRYFSQVKNLRCRLAAYAYLARFEWMLRTVEKDGFRLRRAYPERKSLRTAGWMAWSVVRSMLNSHSRRNIEDSDERIALLD